MNRRSCVALHILLAFTAWAGFAFSPPSRADDPTKAPTAKKTKAEADKTRKADVAKMKAAIEHNGKLPRGKYWHHAEVLHREVKKPTVAMQLKRPAKGVTTKAAALTVKGGKPSSLISVGGEGLPAGFGKGFTWDRAENESLLILFINAADPLGVSIDGVLAGDTVQIGSVSGVGAFSESS